MVEGFAFVRTTHEQLPQRSMAQEGRGGPCRAPRCFDDVLR